MQNILKKTGKKTDIARQIETDEKLREEVYHLVSGMISKYLKSHNYR